MQKSVINSNRHIRCDEKISFTKKREHSEIGYKIYFDFFPTEIKMNVYYIFVKRQIKYCVCVCVLVCIIESILLIIFSQKANATFICCVEIKISHVRSFIKSLDLMNIYIKKY